jgi:uncharacterized membrane protein
LRNAALFVVPARQIVVLTEPPPGGGTEMTTRSLRSRQLAVLLPATVTTGLMAGLFGDWAYTIMPALRATDDRTFVGAFQALNESILHPLFLLAFLGMPTLTGLATLLHLRAGTRAPLPWVTAAFGLSLATFVLTMVVHVPRGNGLMAAGDPDRIADLAAVRAAFHETRRAAWNIVRALATTAAFGCLARALVLHERAGRGAGHGPGRSARGLTGARPSR